MDAPCRAHVKIPPIYFQRAGGNRATARFVALDIEVTLLYNITTWQAQHRAADTATEEAFT